MSRLDDELPSRLIGQRTVHVTFQQDWACEACRRCGGVPFKITGDAFDIHGKPISSEPAEEVLRRADFSHRFGNSCTVSTDDRRFKLGLAWRWVVESGQRRQIFLPKKNGWLPATYSWPPWAG
jgi:hypothetical protein